MNQTLIRWAVLFVVSIVSLNTSAASNGGPATFKFSLDNCNALTTINENQSFTEFRGTAFNTAEINMSAVGGALYRINPNENSHSCTAGLNGTNAMCVSAFDDCYYDAGNEQSVRFDIQLSPTSNQFVRLSKLDFYELAPEVFSWNDGFTSVNDYPTRYALRVLKNGQVIYEQADIQTTQDWSLENFEFTGPEFTVGTPTVFNFELLAYCPAGVNAVQHVWDLEDIEITSECLNQNITNAGEISGGPYTYCIDAGPYFLPAIGLFFQSSQNQDWIFTTTDGTIRAITDNPSDVNVASLGGTLFLQSLSYQNGLSGLSVGSNVSNLTGIFSLSNSISIRGINPTGGTLVGGPYNFCTDGQADFITNLTVSGNTGPTMQWVVTDASGFIFDLPGSIEGVNFDANGHERSFIYNVSYESITGLAIGQNISNIDGCFGLSNAVSVETVAVNGGTLTGGPYQICSDGEADFISNLALSGNIGPNNQWVITDGFDAILDLPADIEEVNFDNLGNQLFIYNVSYASISGLTIGQNIGSLGGCFDISNSVSVETAIVDGGRLMGGPYEFCVDGQDDFITDLNLLASSGPNMSWVVTDDLGLIFDLPSDIAGVNFEGVGEGISTIYNVSFQNISGLQIGESIEELGGCFELSNGVEVVNLSIDNGTLEGGPYSFCIDGEADFISELILTDINSELNAAWVITDAQLNILGIPDDPTEVDFDQAGGGVCFIWHLSFVDEIEGLEIDNNVSMLEGCFGISNSVRVERMEPNAGTLDGGPFLFCLDGVADNVSGITITEASGDNNAWVITNAGGIILALPLNIEDVNFEEIPGQNVFVYNVAYSGEISGLEIDQDLDDLSGCFSVSNRLAVRKRTPVGGTLTGGPYDFCIDGEEDFVTDLVLEDNSGQSDAWIVTDADGVILDLPENISEVNFDDAVAGTCLIYNISFQGDLAGFEAGQNIDQLDGCFGLSNSIAVTRTSPEGGTLTGGPYTFCMDNESDFVTDLSLTGNSGENSSWLITDEDLEIIAVTNQVDTIDFNEAEAGNCLIWNITYSDATTGIEAGNPVADIQGCFAISTNSVTVTRSIIDGGDLRGGPFDFCIDGEEDFVSGLMLSNNNGANSLWVVTDQEGLILELPENVSDINFDNAPGGVCFIFNISFDDDLIGLEQDANIGDIQGCFGLSNSVAVNRTNPQGGTLEGGPYSFCLDDQADFVTDISVSGNSGVNSSWLITDEDLEIIGLTNELDTIDFNGAVPGTCLIWNISYGNNTEGFDAGNSVEDITGCFAISDSIVVTRTEVEGGTLSGGPFNFCLDETADMVSGIELEGNVGANSIFLITDEDGDILELTTQLDTIDFNGATAGICLIWNISYEEGIEELESGNNVSDLVGCFAISNSISVTRSVQEGGTLTSDDFDFMIDGTPDMVSGIELTDTSATNYSWIITDFDLNIIGLPEDIEDVDFDQAGAGICLIWHIGYADGIENLELEANVNDLVGCFDISNSITVNRMASAGGILAGGPFSFCVDGSPDMVSGITLTESMGTNSQWVITNEQDSIIGLPEDIEMVDFDGAGVGICLIYNLSYEDNTTGIELENFLSDIEGTFALSNSITVTRTQPSGGTISGGPYAICIDDTDDFITDLVVSGNIGSTTQWIVTDEDENIITVTDDITTVNFNDTQAGTCLIWSITYEGEVNGLINDSPLNILSGCFALSNSIEVVRSSVSAGRLVGGPYNFCVDMEMDMVSDIVLSDTSGDNNTWVITDEDGLIIGLPDEITDVDFNAAGSGVCLIWNIGYLDGLVGLEVDNNVSELSGCFDLSNNITVTRSGPIAGVLDGGPFNFTIDGIADNVSDITLSGNVSPSEQWIVTSPDGDILFITDDIETINFDQQEIGECLIYHIGFLVGISGFIEGNNLDDIEGCFALSNSITVTKMPSTGGALSGGPFNFCIDEESDFVSDLEITDNMGSVTGWIITDPDGVIIGIPNNIELVDFNEAGVGECYIYHISYELGLTGLEEDSNISELSGIFGLSNFVVVDRTFPSAGTLTGGPYDFCIEGTADMITNFNLTGNDGPNTDWIITDEDGLIISIPDTLENVNFEEVGSGISFIYSITYNNGLEGLAVDGTLDDLDGCFELTSNLTVRRTEVFAGTLTGGPFNFCIDGVQDNVSNISLADFDAQNISWIATDEEGVITHIAESTNEIDFDETGTGTSFLYNIGYEVGLTGLFVGNNIDQLDGCFDLTDAITINKTAPDGGVVNGEAMEICLGDNQGIVTDITVTGAEGSNMSWLITNATADILAVPEDILNFNFNSLGEGECFIWHISYEDGLDGLFVGENINQLDGCFDISDNNVAITKIQPLGGTLSPSTYSFCKDGQEDFLDGLTLADTSGVNFEWVITDLEGVILDLPTMIETIDFDDADLGTCLVYNITYEDGLSGLEVGEDIDDLEGCYDFSNSVQVVKDDCVIMSGDNIVLNEIFPETNEIEIKNVSDVAIDVSEYYLDAFPIGASLSNLLLVCNSSDYILDPGEILAVEINGVLTSNDGGVALYSDRLINNDFDNPDYIIDFVEWGSPGHRRSATAIAAGIWSNGDFVSPFSINNSISYDGIGNSSFDWDEEEASICDENNLIDPDSGAEEARYSIYPNPSSNEIRLGFNKSPAKKGEVRIYNTFGKLLFVKEIDLSTDEVPSINISNLNDGAYIIEVSAKGFSQTQRFIKF